MIIRYSISPQTEIGLHRGIKSSIILEYVMSLNGITRLAD